MGCDVVSDVPKSTSRPSILVMYESRYMTKYLTST